MTTDQEATPLWPFAREARCPMAPPPEYAELRKAEVPGKVELYDGTQAWLVTKYADVKNVIASPGVSADAARDGFPHPSATGAAIKRNHRVFGRMDDPVHAQHRNMVMRYFAVPAVRKGESRVEEIVDDVLDLMEDREQPLDLLTGFALALSSRVMLDVLDLPVEDNEFFAERMDAWNSLASTPEESQGAYHELLDYLGNIIDRRQADPGDDLISTVVREQLNTGNIQKSELVQLFQAVLSGGYDTTANMITLGVMLMSEHQDQLDALIAAPEGWSVAVEELLRYLTVAHHGVYRLALEDIEVGGACIHAGDGIIAPVAAANWDPEVFAEPQALDLTRNARSHLAFGFGVHQCMGQTLARVELRIAFAKLYERFPRLRPVKPAQEQVYKNGIVFGVEDMLVRWD